MRDKKKSKNQDGDYAEFAKEKGLVGKMKPLEAGAGKPPPHEVEPQEVKEEEPPRPPKRLWPE